MKRLPYVDLKYVRWVSIVLAVGLLTVASVSAHAPSEIHLAYDSPTQTLQVTIVHSVSDPATHYIEFVSIKKNGTFFSAQEYTSQPTSSQFTYTFKVPAAPGDVLEVTAECNLGGVLTGRLEVGTSETTEKETTVPELWPVHAVLMVTGFLVMLIATNAVISKTPKTWWLKAHKAAGTLSSILVICGLIVALYMVSQSGGPHFRVYHGYLGGLTLLFTVISPLLGVLALNWKAQRRPLRTVHLWISRTTIVLIVITVIWGMAQAGIL